MKIKNLKKILKEILNKLNDGNEISHDNINNNYKIAKNYLEKLRYIDEFPFERKAKNKYVFIKSDKKRKIFTK